MRIHGGRVRHTQTGWQGLSFHNLNGYRLAFARKRERGERVSARLPYGVELAADGKTLRPSPRDKQLIARIKRLHRGGMHVRQIATKMTAEGYRSRSGASVSKSTVARLLRG